MTEILPKSIRKIDGELWKVDENGNKLKKVQRKSKSKSGKGKGNRSKIKKKNSLQKPSSSVSQIVENGCDHDTELRMVTAIQTVTDLQKQLQESKQEVSRLSSIAEERKDEVTKTKKKMKGGGGNQSTPMYVQDENAETILSL